MAKPGKRMKAALEGLDRDRLYPLGDAVDAIRGSARSRFDETVEIAIQLNVDTRKSDQQVRGTVQLPAGTGKTVRVAVFARDAEAEEAKANNADIVGAEDLAERVQKGEIDFDAAIATPSTMGIVGRLGRILGPRGLMPNPKLGTVTTDVAAAIQAVKGGRVAYRAEKGGVVHAGIGKASFDRDSLSSNALAFVNSVRQARPEGSKGVYIRKVWLSSTMGPSVRVDVTQMEAGAAST